MTTNSLDMRDFLSKQNSMKHIPDTLTMKTGMKVGMNLLTV